MHPNGQLPAYEWNMSDVNPPVHAGHASVFSKLMKKLTENRIYYFLESFPETAS